MAHLWHMAISEYSGKHHQSWVFLAFIKSFFYKMFLKGFDGQGRSRTS